MKRSIDEVIGSDSVPPSAIKRQTSEADADADDEQSGRFFLLASQNKSLNNELARSKRSIAEARKELELMRRKSREMESLVSLIQRAWSQLDIDTSMLLDSLGDRDARVSDEGSSELLHRLVNAGARYMRLDPTHADCIPRIKADQWSSKQDVEKERLRLQNEIHEKETHEHERRESRSDSILEEELNERYGGTVDQNLSAHVSFTLSLLERLCNAINDNNNTNLQIDSVNALNEMRQLRAEKLLLSDRITKLSTELIDLSAKLRLLETDKLRTERELDRTLLAMKADEENRSRQQQQQQQNGIATTNTAATGSVSEHNSADSALTPASPTTIIHTHPSIEKELRKQIALLERQLNESETAKAQVEMTLTERLARPLPQTEVQVADMRTAMEELRVQCKHRVSALLTENDTLQDKVRNLELALSHLEAVSSARIDEVIALTQKEIAVYKTEKTTLQEQYNLIQTDKAMHDQMKLNLTELQSLYDVSQAEVLQLKQRLQALTETYELVRGNYENSQKREADLLKNMHNTTATGATAGASTTEEVQPSDNPTTPPTDTTSGSMLLLQQSQERVSDLQRELRNSSTNISDLILEIDTVSSEESRVRTQCNRLLVQIQDCQNIQRIALEENFALQNQIEELKVNQKDIEAKMELMRSVMSQQDSVIQQLRSAEQTVRVDYQGIKKSTMQISNQHKQDEQSLLEAKQTLQEKENSMRSTLKRNQELQQRCQDLSRQCEIERKMKMEMQRDLSKLKTTAKKNKAGGSDQQEGGGSSAAAGSSAAGTGGLGEDADMLDMTLSMLRCSVCKDRFKSCAITRCFHLFCKECIDENLRNRSRKCPACGEKFGQDDVTPVYFN